MYNGTIVTAKGQNGQARVRLVQNSINANANTSNVTLFYEVYPQNMTNFSTWTWGQTWGAHNVNDSYIDPAGNGDITSPATPTANNTWKTVGSKTFTVTHNEKGVATVYVEFAFNGGDATHTFLVSGEGSATIENTFKATTPTVTFNTQARALNMGSAGTITLPRNSTMLTHKLTFKFGSTTQTLTTNAGASYSWTPAIATYAPQIPNSTTGSGTITCETYNGSTKIGSNTTCVAWLAVPSSVIPTATVTTSDTAGLLATYGGYVQNKSTLQVVVAGTGVHSSTIKGYSSTFNSTTKSGATNTYATTKAGTLAVQGSVTDSRGRVGTRSVNITVLNYGAPRFESISVDRVDQDGNVDQSGAYIKIETESRWYNLNGHNVATSQYRYKRAGGSWSTWTSYINTTTFSANVDYSYDVQLRLVDDFETVTVSRQVPGTFVLVDYGGMTGVEGTGIAFGAAATKANTFLNYLNMESYGTVLVGDAPNRGWAGIQFQSGSYTSLGIRAYDNGTIYGHEMLIQSGAGMIIGSGEYPKNRYDVGDIRDSEVLYLGSDAQVYIETNGNSIANRKTFAFGNGGDLWMPKDGRVWVDSSVIDINATSQASRVTTSGITLRDKNENVVGNVYAEQLANGATGFLLSARRGSTYNAVSLRVANDGTREVYVDAPAEWRKALGLSYAAGDTYTVPSATGQIACAGMITSGNTAVYFFVPLEKPIDATSCTISGNVSVRSPQGYIYPTTAATSTYYFAVNTSGITQNVQLAPNGVFVTLTTSGWVTNSSGTAAQGNRNLTVALLSGFKVTFE